MGFHLLNKVYRNVRGTSSTAQAILAFLAHTADDGNVVKCHPSIDKISDATHFKPGAISNALSDLRDASFLRWESGGRHKGGGGKAFANEYRFYLPDSPSTKGLYQDEPSETCVHEMESAVSTKQRVHTPSDGACIPHQMDTINIDQPSSQPSDQTATPESPSIDEKDTEAEDDVAKQVISELGEQFRVNLKSVARKAEDADRKQYRHSLVDDALRVCGVNDLYNVRIFSSTIMRRDPGCVADIIFQFESEVKQGEHKNARNRAAVLNARLSKLPMVN